MTPEEAWEAIRTGQAVATALPCGHEATGCAFDRDIRRVPVLEPLWEGGPLVDGGEEKLRDFGLKSARVEPCGHEFTLLRIMPLDGGPGTELLVPDGGGLDRRRGLLDAAAQQRGAVGSSPGS